MATGELVEFSGTTFREQKNSLPMEGALRETSPERTPRAPPKALLEYPKTVYRLIYIYIPLDLPTIFGSDYCCCFRIHSSPNVQSVITAQASATLEWKNTSIFFFLGWGC